MKVETAVVDGMRVRVARSLRGAPRTLVINAAWPQSIVGLEQLWPELSAEFDLLAFDMPGFGASEARDGIMRPSAQGAFWVQLLQHFGLKSVHVLALDVGVPAVLFALARHGEHFASATLANGVGCHPPTLALSLKMLVSSSLARSTVALTPSIFVRTADRDGHRRGRAAPHALDDYLACYTRERLAQTFAYLATYPEELPRLDAELARVRTRVTLFWGREDVYLPVQNANDIARRLPDAQVRELSGVGHFSHDDARSELVQHLIAWC